jgi:small ligand-binding sensory domain FIST
MNAQPVQSAPGAACAVNRHLDTRTAGTEIAEQLHDAMAGRSDLVLAFASHHHRAALSEAVKTIRGTLNPTVMLATTAEAVLGAGSELEGVAGLSVMALRLPGVELTPWTISQDDPLALDRADEVAEHIGYGAHFRAAIMLADPFTTPMPRLLPSLTGCGGEGRGGREGRGAPIIGGMASGGNQPGFNLLIANDTEINTGAVGVSLSGAVDVSFVVSQGCRPVGRAMTITKAKENRVLELDGQPALELAQETARNMSAEDRMLLQGGLLIGCAIDDRKTRFGRGDFLIRNVVGMDKDSGAVVMADYAVPGRTVQFHIRDAQTAEEDLQLLLDAQVMHDDPFAGLLFTCNGRGRRLYGEPDTDTQIIAERLNDPPVAGFFAAGEIGPIGGRSFLHGHTAALALFRGA